MSTKIIKAGAAEPDVFETSISQALVELETNSDLKAQLRELYITKAKEIELHNKKVRGINLDLFWNDSFHSFYGLPAKNLVIRASNVKIVHVCLECHIQLSLGNL